MWKHKNLSDDQLYDRGVMYIKAAAKLGAPFIRLLHEEHLGSVNFFNRDYHLTNAAIAERLLPVCAEYNVTMALECHAPTTVDDPCHEPYLEAAERLGLPYVGLQADFSSYEYCITSADVGQIIRQGGTPEVLNTFRQMQRDAYFSGKTLTSEEVAEAMGRLKPNEIDNNFLRRHSHFGKRASYDVLKAYASKLVYVHGKFYDIDAEGQVDNIDYPKVMKALVDGGYKGYISSEFEGNRRMNDAGWVDEIEYVRKHQELMRSCLGYV